MFGFDMTDFLANDAVRGPVLGYLFHRIGTELIDGSPLVIAIDEFWRPLGDPGFRDWLEDKLKTMRKQNGFFVFATQSPADALRSPIAHSIIDQCATQILLPNSKATPEHYMTGLKLSPREYALVRQEMADRQFLIRQDRASVVAELDLTGFDDELAVLSGRQASVELLDRLRTKLGDDPALWMPAFLQANRAAERGNS